MCVWEQSTLHLQCQFFCFFVLMATPSQTHPGCHRYTSHIRFEFFVFVSVSIPFLEQRLLPFAMPHIFRVRL